jgi:hypothetical protein
LATTEILDAEAVRAIDPLWPSLFPLWSTLTSPAELRNGDNVIARIAPTDAGQRPVGDLSAAGYAALCAAFGTDDTADTDDRWTVEGQAAMRAVLADMPRGQLPTWRGELESRMRQAECVGRLYGMSPEAIASVTGRTYVARKGLLPTCGRAHELAERKRVADEAAAIAKVAAEEAAAETARPKTLRELGAEGLEVKKGRVGARRDPISRREIVEPFEGAWRWCVGETDDAVYFAWMAPAGLELPVFEADGARVLRREEIPPIPLPTLVDATADALKYIREMRGRFGTYDTGPIVQWSSLGVDRAKALAAAFASSLSTSPAPTGSSAWVRGWLCSAVVRGLRVRPDVAAAIIAEEAERAALAASSLAMPRHVRMTDAGEDERAMAFEVMRDRAMENYTRAERDFLLQSAGRSEIEALCVKAASGGDISAGALLDERPPAAAAKSKKAGH